MKEELLYRYLCGEVTPIEKEQIGCWLAADPEAHQKELNRVRFIFEGIQLYGDQLAATEVEVPRKTGIFKTFGRYVLRAAAACIVLAGSAYLVRTYTYRSLSDRLMAIDVPAGQHIKITLEDGSTVWLNAGTRLEYPVAFTGDVRRVKLSGEAMFDVQHNDKQPFIVETFASDVQVVGTRFNVIADETCDNFSTALFSGCVRVTNRLNDEQIVMLPNSIVSLDNGHLKLTEIENPDEYRWPEGIIALGGVPFDRLMKKFERAYGVQIRIDRQAVPLVENMSGKLRIADGIDHALDVLRLGADFSYRRDNEQHMIIIE